MKKRTITTLMACMLLLSGCSNSTKETQPAQTEAPAVTETTTAATEAADFVSGLEHISVQLPEDILRESVSETQDHFLYDGEIVGGIAQMDVDAAIMEAPFENEETILTSAVIRSEGRWQLRPLRQ